MTLPSYEILLNGFPGRSSRGFLGWSTVTLLNTSEGYALFDTGAHGDRPGLLAALAERGIPRDDIRHIVLSHLHFDHVANAECFPNAEIILHETEYAYGDQYKSKDAALSQHQVEAVFRSPRLTLVSGEIDVLPGIRMIKTPGHTGGHVSLSMVVDGERVILAQDAIKHRLEVETGISAGAFDAEAAGASIRRIAALADVVVPGHDGPFRLKDGKVVEHTPSMAEIRLTTADRSTRLES
jgi:glyoxylase-like metal-dependent hydrolase (beta-lactamase superfamily II)